MASGRVFARASRLRWLAQTAETEAEVITERILWPGIAAMAVMYGAVFLVGTWAGRPRPGRHPKDSPDSLSELMLAGRSLPLWLLLLTMTATWVGGGYINGTAEATFKTGVVWGAQAGIGYALSLILGGLLFAAPMRRRRFATLVDPLEMRYGRHIAAVLMVPAVLGEIFWSASILVALGSTFGTIVGLDLFTATVVSAAVAVGYTVVGGLRSVAYTDVIQLGLIVLGLGLAIPFALDTAGGWQALRSADVASAWRGFGSATEALQWSDWTLLFILGGIPWNVYFQRVLSATSEDAAARMSIYAGCLCAMLAIPPILLGLAGRAIDWGQIIAADGGMALVEAEAIQQNLAENGALVLPYLLRYAVPMWVAVCGLGAISAAVMSSVDSSILSASSLVAWNGYRRLFRPQADTAQMTRLVRILVVLFGTASTLIALSVGSVASLWYLCGDVVYCVLFPQLTMALFDRKANRLGAVTGFAISVVLRIGGGDKTLGLPAFLGYPSWGEDGQAFPFRTLSMLAGLAAAFIVSRLTQRQDPPRALRTLE